jgi:hypothetical protein
MGKKKQTLKIPLSMVKLLIILAGEEGNCSGISP